jgi:phosphatidylglycerol---prolipoprotein diacylglyceryl transferase
LSFPYLQDLVRAATGIDVPLPLPTFGLCVLAAVAVSIQVAKAEVRRRHAAGQIGLAVRRIRQAGRRSEVAVPPQDLVVDFGLIITLAGIVGARIFSMLEVPRDFVADPLGLIFSRQGFNFFGGLVFGVSGGMLYFRRHRLPVLATCDAFAPAMMLGYALGRVGCQLAGDGDWGIPANMALKPHWLPGVLWAQTYDHNVIGETIAPPGVYPTPLYEIAMGLLAFAILWSLRKLPARPGWLFCLYLLLCGLERSAIELIRVNPRISLLGLEVTQAQVIAAVITVVGAVGLAMRSGRTAGLRAARPHDGPAARG